MKLLTLYRATLGNVSTYFVINIRRHIVRKASSAVSMVKAKKFIYCKAFDGPPNDSNFKYEEEELPALKDGEALFEAIYLSVDPYMRVHGNTVGTVAVGDQICKVIESKNSKYAVGSEWVGYFGWRTHTICNPDNMRNAAQSGVLPLPPLGELPHSLGLGMIGLTGATAYFGLLTLHDLKAGETVLVSGAAGGVGSTAGQLAKIKGCKVIGHAGTDDKVQFLKELGFDHAYNYKTRDLGETLKEAAPDGVDFYFDNVGGKFTDTVISEHMNYRGRIALIGGISTYNSKTPETGPRIYSPIRVKQLKVGGIMSATVDRKLWEDAYTDMIKWIKEGKLKYREHVTEGFDKLPEAFSGLFTGQHTGKAIVKV